MDTLVKFFKHSVWGQSLILLLLYNLVIRLVAIFGYFILPQHFAPLNFLADFWKSNFIFWSLANFDGEHYLSIAKFGYQIRNGFPQYAFYPIFPLLIQGFAFILHDYYLAGVIVAQLSLWIALTYISKWCRELKLANISLLLLTSTGAIFLASIYTEPVFLALAASAMYYAEKKSWLKSALLVGLSTATRINGVFLALFLFIKLLKSSKSMLVSSLYFILSISGLLGYMTYLSVKTGDAFAWFHAQSAWGKAVATSPLSTLIGYLKAVSVNFVPDLTHLVVIIEVVTTLSIILLFLYLLSQQKLDLAYWVYLAGNFALPIATGSLGSMPRFFLTLFPLLIIYPSLPRPTRTMYTIFSLTSSALGVILFTRGYWYG